MMKQTRMPSIFRHAVVMVACLFLAVALLQRQSDLRLEKIEAGKLAWNSLLGGHPYYTRQPLSETELKSIPKQDRPDLAHELDFLKTMDPALGNVPYERLFVANKKVEQLLQSRAAIPGVSWVERGPQNVGGRTRALMFDPNDPDRKKVWAAGVGGGLWYTLDITAASPTWLQVDDFWDNLAVTAIAFNPANTQEFYVGTGEGWYNGGSQNGTGIWKSANGGVTWTNLASTNPGAYNSSSDFHCVQKIVIKNDGSIFVATRGYFVNRGGILKSVNGGNTWSKVLTVYNGSGQLYDRAADIEIAANGDLYASFGIASEGKVFKSTNAGNGNAGSWTDLSSNIGIGTARRIELACAASNSNVIYAVAQASSGGSNDVAWFKKSTNGGTTWTTVTIPKLVDDNTTHFTRGQAFYDLILGVHPANENLVIAGGIDLHRSTNGGSTWTGISHWYGGFSKPYVHADQHAMIFRPGDPNYVLFGNDGGLFLSTNAGNAAVTPSFEEKNNGYNVTQFYACATKNAVNSHYFLAGSQDNGTQMFNTPQMDPTEEVTGGDGGFCHIDQINSDIQLTSYVYNNIYRSFNGGGSFSTIVSQSTGHFINPSEYDNERKILYAASENNLIKRVSGISGTITNADLAVAVGTSKISCLKMSPYSDLLVFGVANGRVYKYANASTSSPSLTRIDNGSTPITTTGWVSSIDIGANNDHILVTYSNYGVISVWETTNGGTTWRNKEGDLPDIPVRWGIYNPLNRNEVLIATELGVWSTNNFQAGTAGVPSWGPSNTDLAHTRCDMLKYRPADKLVVVASYGRGLFTSDIFVTAPIADFSHNGGASCSGSLTVQFIDGSLKPDNSWAWDIDNNGTTDYMSQNPVHTYSGPGLYSVKLSISNNATSITKDKEILVMTAEPTPVTGCPLNANSNTNNPYGIGLYRFALGSIDHSTSYNDGHGKNYACSRFTSLALSTTYTITIRTGTVNAEGAKVYIDYNDNGILETSEAVASFPAHTTGTRSANFTTPASGVVLNKGLRMRVLSKFNSVPGTGCDVGTYGQAEDYTVFFSDCQTMVTQSSGTGSGSLPAAILCATSGATITISSSLAGQTINIGAAAVLLNKNLTIIAQGSNTSITGTGLRVFEIQAGKQVQLTGLNVKAGIASTAGAIMNNGTLTLNNVSLTRNPGNSSATLLQSNTGAQLTLLGNCNLFL